MPCDTEKESVLSSETVIISPQKHYVQKELLGQGKVMSKGRQLWFCRVGFGTQIRAQQEERSLRQDLSPVPGLAQGRPETISLGQSAYSAGATSHTCAWKIKPELIKMKSCFPPLAVTCPCTSLGPITLSLLSKELTSPWIHCVSYE